MRRKAVNIQNLVANLVVVGAAALQPHNGLQPGRKSVPCMQIVRNVDFMCLFVNLQINKAVVGSGWRDMPKYVGEGVASCGPWGKSSRPNGSLNRSFHTVFHVFI